MQLKARLFLY